MNPARLLAVLAVLCVAAAGCAGRPAPSQPFVPAGAIAGAAELRGEIVRAARSQLGADYAWGGCDPAEGFDCSGLVWWAYRVNGVAIPRVTSGQRAAGTSVSGRVLPADVVVFATGKGASGLHTGIATGRGSFVHSPKSGDAVREDELDNSYWRARLLDVRRIIE